jgi:eukaryotic-like serine/threonine-protein kinase
MRVQLSVIEGPYKGRQFTFDGHDTFIVGRAKEAHFPIIDKYFSRNHFMAEINPPNCRLMDLNSTNGTYVNGKKVATVDLRDGDLIKGGMTVLRVTIDEAATGLVPASAPLPPEATRSWLPADGTKPLPIGGSVPVPDTMDFAIVEEEEDGPTPQLPSEHPSGARCPVCETPLNLPRSAGRDAPARLCTGCEEKARQLSQPIVGYQVVRELGRGGMGVVSVALRVADGLPVALKTIIPAVAGTEDQVERFLREASILRELEHSNIVAFRDLGESCGQLYFAMDYVRGHDVSRLLKANGGPLAPARAVSLVCQLLSALEYAHAKGFVHRDIKPANLLVEARGGREVLKLADFGLARVYQSSRLSGLTMMGDLGGTMAYMAPEQITHFREAKPAADQYAAGATLYRLLTDRAIYNLPKQIHEQIPMILQEPPVPILSRRPDLPEPLAQIIHRSLVRDPSGRFPGAREMRNALLPFAK